MFSAIRSSHRPTTPIARVTAAPDLPRPRRKRRRRVGAAAIVRAVAGLVAVLVGPAIMRAVTALVVVLVGAAAVILRDKLASIVSRRDGGEEQAPDAAEK